MENKFEVKGIIPAQKKGYVVIEVTYKNTGKTYAFVRKNYSGSAVIEGYRISFHYNSGKYVVDKVEQEYETAGKKVTNTSNKGISESIKADC